ncbi:hypothetical protein FE257_002836, partial [Aspergillus nanangensis]
MGDVVRYQPQLLVFVLDEYELAKMVTQYLSLKDMVKVMLTCKTIKSKETSKFLAELKAADGVIVGEFVRQFFERDRRINRMAISFVHGKDDKQATGSLKLKNCLCDVEGYKPVKPEADVNIFCC